MNPESDSLHQMDDYGSGSGTGPVPYDDEDADQDWPPNYSGSGDDSIPITNVPGEYSSQFDADHGRVNKHFFFYIQQIIECTFPESASGNMRFPDGPVNR